MSARFNRDDGEYYRGRAIEELVAAQKATCGAARQRHEALAELYRLRSMLLQTALPSWSCHIAKPVREADVCRSAAR